MVLFLKKARQAVSLENNKFTPGGVWPLQEVKVVIEFPNHHAENVWKASCHKKGKMWNHLTTWIKTHISLLEGIQNVVQIKMMDVCAGWQQRKKTPKTIAPFLDSWPVRIVGWFPALTFDRWGGTGFTKLFDHLTSSPDNGHWMV